MKTRLAVTISGLTPLAWAAPLVLLAACGDSGPERAEVTGTVTLDGDPLPEATVVFQPAQGSPSIGETGSRGRYRLEYTAGKTGATLGKHRVSITTGCVKGPPGNEKEVPERVPPEYNTESQITRQVEPGENVFDLPIKTSP